MSAFVAVQVRVKDQTWTRYLAPEHVAWIAATKGDVYCVVRMSYGEETIEVAEPAASLARRLAVAVESQVD